MKLSAKWLTALAAVALLAVAVAGSARNTNAAVGTIYVANEWSKLTTDPNVWAGYIYAGSGKSVFATYRTTDAAGATNKLIATAGAAGDAGARVAADRVRVAVVDAGKNTTTTLWDDGDATYTTLFAGAGYSLASTTTIGTSQIFTLLGDPANPIAAAALSDIKLIDRGAARTAGVDLIFGNADDVFTLVSSSVIAVTNKFDGDGVVAPWIQVTRNSGATAVPFDIRFPTSVTEYISATVKTDITTAGLTVNLIETSRASGRFEGVVDLVENKVPPALGAIAEGSTVPITGIAGTTTAAKIRVLNGPVTLEYTDSDSVLRTAQVLIDTIAPTVAVTAPAQGSATQNRVPTFSGSVTDSGAGLKLQQATQTISSVTSNVGPGGFSVGTTASGGLFIDKTDDAANATKILTTPGTVSAGNAYEVLTLGTVVDGQASLSYSHTPGAALPTLGVGIVPDHLVDFQVKIADLAGNFGFSDSDTSTVPQPAGGVTTDFNSHSVRIDQKIPAFKTNSSGCSPVTSAPLPGLVCENATGKVYDSVTKLDSTTLTDRKNIKVQFDGSVTNVDAGDFSVAFDVGGTHVPASAVVNGAVVYLTLVAEVPANDTPLVSLVGSISDLAGNSTPSGSVTLADGVPPKVTVTRSGGTGTGTGSEDATNLTKGAITITVTLDESVSAVPTVDVWTPDGADAGTDPDVEATAVATVAQGNNVYSLSYTSGVSGEKRIRVNASDSASNVATSGNSTTKSYTVDLAFTAPTVTVTGQTGTTTFTTSSKKPFITLDFAGELSSITITAVTLDTVDVTATLVAQSDKKKFFMVPAANLTNAEHTVAIAATKATDAAGNTNAAVSFKFTVVDRKTFDMTFFAGWNAVSVPSNPVDAAIESVFTNKSIDQVVAYDATNPANPWSITTRDATSGAFKSTTERPLTAIMAGPGYWVHTTNFEPTKVLLVGPVDPSAGSPPPITSIPVAKGWNLIGVSDPSRIQTEGASGATLLRGATVVTASDYFNGVVETRVYRYNPTTLGFEEVTSGMGVKIGDALWVNITDATGSITP